MRSVGRAFEEESQGVTSITCSTTSNGVMKDVPKVRCNILLTCVDELNVLQKPIARCNVGKSCASED